MRHFMNRSVLFLIGIICIASVAFTTLAQAETLVESSLFFRIYVAFSVDEKAAQAWLPDPWKVVPIPKGPFKGANVQVVLDDRFIMQDGEGKPYVGEGEPFCLAALVSLGKNEKTGEIGVFVIRVYWPYDDTGSYKNGVKAAVSREATIKSSVSGTGSEFWKVQDNAAGMIEFQMDYQRGLPTRTKTEIKGLSNVDPNILVIYRDDYVGDVVKSVPAGIDRVKNFKFRVTMSELRKMFDGSEQLVGISVNPSRVRLRYSP
ncbi:MAG: hypothetical protein ACWGP1_18010 [Syntrophobacteria bacterium]